MRDFFSLFGGDSRMVRDFALMAFGIVGVTLIAAHGLSYLVAINARQEIPQISAADRDRTRTYLVTRSVLDDPINTGSINQIRFDPCKK